MVSVDVIVVTYQSAGQIESCLEAARACPQVGRLLVVDNASTDGSLTAAVDGGADLVVESPVNMGFARGVNRGLPESTAEHVLLLNPDALLSADALDRLVAALAADPGAVMAGPMLRSPDGAILAGGRRFSTVVNRLLWHLPLPVRPAWSTPDYLRLPGPPDASGGIPVDYLWGASLLCRRRFLDEIGGLDERYFMYSEDEDLGRQARLRGFRCVIVTDAAVRHAGGASSDDRARAQARIEASNTLLLAKWEGECAARAFAAGIGPVLTARALLFALAGRRAEASFAWRTCRLLAAERRRATAPAAAAGQTPQAPCSGTCVAAGYALGTVRLTSRVLRRPGILTAEPAAHRPLGLRPDHPEPLTTRASIPKPHASSPDARPTVSVIMPVYNAARADPDHLSQALESVAGQSFADLELIVVDDGSTDGTPRLVESFQTSHPELDLQILVQPNGGQSSARNLGAEHARGEWLSFLDQDDVWLPDRLHLALGAADERTDLVYTDADVIDDAGFVVQTGIHRNHGLGGGHPDIPFEDLILQDVFVMPGVMLLRKGFFDAIGGFDARLSGYEDDDLFVRASQRGRIAYVAAATLRWRIHGNSYSHSSRMVVSGLRYWRKLVAAHGGDGAAVDTTRRITLRFVRVFLSYASAQLLAGDPLYVENIAAAQILVEHLDRVDRIAFASTTWAWTSTSFSARCARSWFLNGLQLATPAPDSRRRAR
jgi:GT2 family glycosyltransferase